MALDERESERFDGKPIDTQMRVSLAGWLGHPSSSQPQAPFLIHPLFMCLQWSHQQAHTDKHTQQANEQMTPHAVCFNLPCVTEGVDR